MASTRSGNHFLPHASQRLLFCGHLPVSFSLLDFAILKLDFTILKFDFAILKLDFAILKLDFAILKLFFQLSKSIISYNYIINPKRA